MENRAYYEAVAQIIPLLLIVIMLEIRAPEATRFMPRWTRILALFLMLLVLTGEVAALVVLSRNEVFRFAPLLTRNAIVFEILVLAVTIYGQFFPPRRNE